jgi:multiple sugar transport system permease protein
MLLTLEKRRWLWAYGFIAIPLLFFLTIRIWPTIQAFRLSLYDYDPLDTEHTFRGLGNYADLLHDKIFWQALRNTVLYVLYGVPTGLVFSLLIALGLKRVNHFRGFLRFLYFLPYVTALVAVSWIWRWLYQPNGLFNDILHRLHLPHMGFLGSTGQALISVTVVTVWYGLGFQVIIFLAGLEGIPDVFYEAAEIDGATTWQRFRYVTLPLLNPTIVFLAVIGVIQSLQIFTQIRNLTTNGGPLNSTISLVLYVYQLSFQTLPARMGYGAAVTVVLFAMILVITIVQLTVLTRRYEY